MDFHYLLGVTLNYYYYMFLLCLFVFFTLVILVQISKPIRIVHFYSKFSLIYFVSQAVAVLLAWVCVLRPKNVANAGLGAWCIAHVSPLVGITWEVRNAEILEQDIGAVVCANHRSSIDVFGLFNIWTVLKKVSAIAKKEMLWLVPFGPIAWLAGVVFIDRKSPGSAFRTLEQVRQVTVEKNIKIYIYPEGTRNRGHGLLPFKNGAFKTAIEAQIPIIPLVFSPYYFMDEKNYIFNEGHVIVTVLEPIPTTGLTLDDLPVLKQRTFDIMLEHFEKISREIDRLTSDKEWLNKKWPRLTITRKSN